jgi:hypothetical protein
LTPARIDWPLLLIPLIGLVAVWSFLTQSLPSTDDGALHLFRLAEIDRCLRHGVLPLRWAPDFAHGYGYPFFNYYASLSSYIAELWHLIGLDFPQAIAGAIVTAFFTSGWGAYLLGRDLAGRKAGLIAATAYMYAPYQFYDSAYRGNLAETWALALLPWVLWAGRRAAQSRRWRDIVPCALCYGALVYTHNVYALISSPVLGLYLLLLWWQNGHSWRDAWQLASMIGLGLASSAFFWLPAFFEKSWTRFSTELVDYRTFFLPIKELLAWPPQVDLSRLNAYPPRSLSWGMLILVALGVILVLTAKLRLLAFSRVKGKQEEAFFFGVFLLASFMTVRPSDPLWRTVPLINFALIPWRYLGIASLAGSLVAGRAVSFLPDRATFRSAATIGTGMAIVLLIATAVPWTYAAPFPQPQNVGVAEIVGWEYSSKLIGTTAKNEFLPIWSPRLPPEPADPAYLTDQDPIIARLDATSLPKDAELISAKYTLTRADLVIDTPQAFRARYKQFYFPGWRVTVDGRSVPQIATLPYGLLGFDLPAGRHRIVIQPTTTPLRLIGVMVTLLAALTMVFLTLYQRRSVTRHSGLYAPEAEKSSDVQWAFIAILALLLLGIKEGLIDHTENLFRARRFDGARVPGVQRETQINFGNVFTLHGYDLPTRPVVAGQPLRVHLYLSARQAVDGDYMAYARLVDGEGRLWSLPNNGAPEGFRPPPPTTIWPTDAYGHWAYLTYTLPGTPPGEYWIEVAFFERGTWRTLNVLNPNGLATSLTTRVGPVQVARPHTPPDLDALGIKRPLYTQVGPDLQCLGSVQDVRSARAGGEVNVTLFWQASRAPTRDYHLELSLGDKTGTMRLSDDLPLGRDTYPTSAWSEGEVVRSPHRLRIPAAADTGTHTIEATVVDEQGDPIAPPFIVGEVVLDPTDRQMTVPAEMGYVVHINLGRRVTLLGYDLPASDDRMHVARDTSLPVTLYWQAQDEMQVSYKVFVQLIGLQGVVSQVDTAPVNWARPTTGWIMGEVVTDPYSLPIPADVPSGEYQLTAGMYDEGTLQRLAVLDDAGAVLGDHIILGEAVVE